ncbi:MAG: folate-binding protein YgfZ [Flavobacteriales bacterium]
MHTAQWQKSFINIIELDAMPIDWEKHIQAKPANETEGSIIPIRSAAFIRIVGPDAEKFLQGQCSCDFSKLSVGDFSRGAQCNPKGRMITTFLAYRANQDCFVLRVNQSILLTALAALKKYAVFSKIEITEFTSLECIGVSAENNSQKYFSQARVFAHIPISEKLFEYWITTDESDESGESDDIFSSFSAYNLLPEACWKLAIIRSGIHEIDLNQSEVFLPQELNYDLIQAVSFKKGCYTGQEIIARLHYRGQSKKRTHYGVCRSQNNETNAYFESTPKDRIKITQNNKSIGFIISGELNDDGSVEFLALVDNQKILSEENCFIENTAQKVEWPTLPYAIPK